MPSSPTAPTKAPAKPSSDGSATSWERVTTLPEGLVAFGQKSLAFHVSRDVAITGVVLAATPTVIVLRLAKTRQVVLLNPAHVLMVREALT